MMHVISVQHRTGIDRTRARNIALVGLLLMLLSCVPKLCFAASSCHNNGNLNVTVSATGISFGSYDVLSPANTSGTGTITVAATCDHANSPFTVNYTIALSTGGSGNFTARTMASGSSTLQYNLYTTAAFTSIWGDGSGGSQTVADMITGTCTNPGGRNCGGSQPDAIYGYIPAMQNIAAGNYSDSLTVTVSF